MMSTTDLTRQYKLPTPISNSTCLLVEKHTNEATPELQDLITMKADLETILPLSENRLKDLKRDLAILDKSVKVRDNNGAPAPAATSGKNMNVIMEKMKIKQETDDTDNRLLASSPNIPKNELSRQAALDAIRRRRRREETESSSEDTTRRRSESPHHTVKLKRLDGLPSFSQSVSPSPTPKQLDMTKKKKSNNNNARQQQHPLSKTEEVDFVRIKPKDQVPIATFWSTLEPYFRSLTEEDRQLLLEKLDRGKPYLIPPLGTFYADRWAEEDQAIGFTTATSRPTSKLKYLHQQSVIADENLLSSDIGCGTLTERLLSSLVAEEIIDASEAADVKQEHSDDDTMRDVETATQTNGKVKHHGRTIVELSSDLTDEIVDFEERLKRELRYAGLFTDDDIDWNAREDDEISAELRTLGRELKEQVKVNDYRKQKLLEVVDTHLAFEQYRQVLDNLDSQVEQGYMKRFRPQKSKKRKTNGPKTMLSENAVYAMDKRRNWKNALGIIFEDKNMVMPSSSIYE